MGKYVDLADQVLTEIRSPDRKRYNELNELNELNGQYAYRFKLRDGGGTYLTPAPTLEQAEAELRHKYGDSLLLVVAGLPVPRPQQ